MNNGFYKELEILKKEFDNEIDGFYFLENIYISDSNYNLYNYIHGFCIEFAYTLNEIFKYPIKMLYNEDNKFVHSYCEIEIDNKRYFIDARGITDNWNEFIDEYIDWITFTNKCKNIKEITSKELKNNSSYTVNDNAIEKAKKLIQYYNEYYINFEKEQDIEIDL